METKQNYALYYPSIEFQRYESLWSASLLWDRIYRIVPSGYTPADPENVRILAEAGDIGIPIRPDVYAAKVAAEFMSKANNGSWSAAALEFDRDSEYVLLHPDKVDVQLRSLIIEQGGDASRNDWLHVPTEFAKLYMTYLAQHIAKENSLQLVSDSAAAWTGATYFRHEGEVEPYPIQDLQQQLAMLVVRDFVPENILAIAPNDLIRFREKYRTERQRFVNAIQVAASTLSNCNDPKIAMDHVADIKRDIDAALDDYRGSLRALKVTGLTGLKTIAFPILTTIATAVFGKELDPSALTVVSAASLGLGLVSGLSDYSEKRRRLDHASDYSYLLQIKREWKGCAMYDNDYNYYLCRQMEEFIND
jgi:hypothetical protein